MSFFNFSYSQNWNFERGQRRVPKGSLEFNSRVTTVDKWDWKAPIPFPMVLLLRRHITDMEANNPNSAYHSSKRSPMPIAWMYCMHFFELANAPRVVLIKLKYEAFVASWQIALGSHICQIFPKGRTEKTPMFGGSSMDRYSSKLDHFIRRRAEKTEWCSTGDRR